MRILHVIDQLSQKTAGGSARVCYQLAAAEARAGHEVVIYTTDYHFDRDFVKPAKVEVRAFHCLLNFMGGIRLSPSIVFVEFREFDIIHLHNYRTAINIFARWMGEPWVMQAQGSAHGGGSSIVKPVSDRVWTPTIRQANGLLALNDTEAKQYIAEGADPSKIKIMPIGIDLKEFTNLPAKANNGIKRIVYLGRLHYNKGIDLLIDAFSEPEIQNNAVLDIYGVDDGDYRRLVMLANKKDVVDRISFKGGIYGREKVEMLRQADVLVMPSRYEAWGLSFMEALACGTPVIMTRNCEAAEVLPSYCGRVVDFDSASLAFALKDILYRETDRDFWKKSSEMRREWVSQFDWDILVPQYIKVYQEAKADFGEQYHF